MSGSYRYRQQGLSMWQWLVILGIIGLTLIIAVAIGPVYVTNFSVQSTVKALQNEPELAAKSVSEVRGVMERKFDVNQIDVIQAVCRDKNKACVKIEKSKTLMKIDANYEVRVHVLGNVDAVVVFKNNFVEIPITGGI